MAFRLISKSDVRKELSRLARGKKTRDPVELVAYLALDFLEVDDRPRPWLRYIPKDARKLFAVEDLRQEIGE